MKRGFLAYVLVISCLAAGTAASLAGEETLVLKLRDKTGASAKAGRLELPSARLAIALSSVPGVSVEPIFDLPRSVLEALRQVGEARSGHRLADLSQYFAVHVPHSFTKELEDLRGRLQAMAEVEYAYTRPSLRLPVDVAPPTPDLLNNPPGQGYRDPAPSGIDIDFAWSQGLLGQGVTVTDIEANWNLNHEDLDHLLGQMPPVPMIDPLDWNDPNLPSNDGINHGTATLGVLAAGDNGYGATGLVPGSKIRVVPFSIFSDPSFTGPNAVLLATLQLTPGDVILLEMEVEVPGTNDALPFEFFPLEYAVVRQATALGLHVIEPAGNSPDGLDLDRLGFEASPMAASGQGLFDLSQRDSGAVMVGGGASLTQQFGNLAWHDRYVNSNFGSRTDTYAWAQNVTTLGFGPSSSQLANCDPPDPADPLTSFNPPNMDQWYTRCYNGTSSAGAIVAGAAAVLEQKHRADFGQPFASRELRNLLRLGTPDWAGEIGHQPDLAFQSDFMDRGGIIPHLFEAAPIPCIDDQQAQETELGYSVASAGDVNADGVPDILVGAPSYYIEFNCFLGGPFPGAVPYNQAGRVWLYSGADGGILSTFDGDLPGDRFGHAVASAGDVNGDGVPDIAVGAPGDGVNSGYVRIFSGQGRRPPLFTLMDYSPTFGASVAGVGDQNGDGFDDVAVGVPGSAAGYVVLYSGRNGRVINTLTGTQNGSEFGFAVASAPDLDADGRTDVFVGAPLQQDAQGDVTGAAFVYSRLGTPLLTLPPSGGGILPFPGGKLDKARYGHAVANAGDVDGDGQEDLLVGAPGWSSQQGVTALGRAYLYTGSGQLIDAFKGTDAFDTLGFSVAGIGDFDGDGWNDVAVGQANEPDFMAGGQVGQPGRAMVFLGPFPQADLTDPHRLFRTKDLDTRLGRSVAAAGDVNRDGLADLIAGEPRGAMGGRAFVFSAAPGPPPAVAKLAAELPAIEAKDVDGNGFGGGLTSPSTSTLHFDAGPDWAGAIYTVTATPNLGPFLQGATGTLDAEGKTSTPTYGPIPSMLLCPALVGAQVSFVAVATKDIDGDGVAESVMSQPAVVTIINEFNGCC